MHFGMIEYAAFQTDIVKWQEIKIKIKTGLRRPKEPFLSYLVQIELAIKWKHKRGETDIHE